MKQIKTAICDDEIFLLPQLAAMIKNLFRSYHLDSEPDTFDSAAGLLNQIYQSVSYDVYFLDIDIPGQDGITLAKKIKTKTPNALIVFISAKEERVYESFHVQPLAFVRKSHFSTDMPQAMEVLVKYLQKPADQVICFHDELGHPIPLNLTRIMYVEAKGKYQDVVSIDDHTMVRCSITELEKALSPHAFLRIHRGYLVNARYIYRIHTNHILLDSGQKLPLSLQRKKEVQNLFLEYVRSVSGF